MGYEQKYYFGKDDNNDLPELVAGRTRKPMMGMRNFDDGQIPMGYLSKMGDRNTDTSTLTSELNKQY